MTSSSREHREHPQRATGRRTAACPARRPRGAARGRSGRARSRRGWRRRRPAGRGPGVGLGHLGDEQAQPGVAAAADPPAQLVQLGDAEPVGVHDHHHGGVGHVDPDLDRRWWRPARRPRRPAKRRMTSSLSSGGIRPCSTSTRSPASGPAASCGRRSRGRPAAAGASPCSSSSPALGVLRLGRRRRHRSAGRRRRPGGRSPTSSRDPLPGARRGSSASRAAGTTWAGDRRAACRAARSSVDTSRSPKTVIATVRGIGVAVMTSTCGGCRRALARRAVALLHAEAVLLVDDDQPEVEELHLLLEQGVGADDDAGLARGDVEQRLPRRAAVRSSR